MNLNLGSGPDYREGYVNVDLSGHCDQIVDLRNYPWPWESDSCDEIIANDIIEHLTDTLGFMNECHRILRVGGKLEIRTPSYDAEFAWTDPTHVKLFTIDTWDFFDPTTAYGSYNVHLTDRKWKIVSKEKSENCNLFIVMEKI